MNGPWEQIKLFFSRLFSRGQHGVETMRETLDRQARIQRMVAQARALTRERNGLVVTIGKKVYSLHTRGKIKNRDVLSDCLRIDQIRTEIETLKRQIEELRLDVAGELPPIDLEDESALDEDDLGEEAGAEEAEELAPAQADGPAPEKKRASVKAPPEVDEAEDGTEEPAGV